MLTAPGVQREQPKGVVMDESLFRKLPDELLEKVLASVPIPDLILQCTLVCKKWGKLIMFDPTFQTKARSRASYLLISANVVNLAHRNDTWDIRDIESGSNYKLAQRFLAQKLPYVLDSDMRVILSDHQNLRRCTIAADGGFVAVLWQYKGWDINAIFIVNPVTHSCRVFPVFPRTSMGGSSAAFGLQSPCVAMVVADDRKSFKLFVIQEPSPLPSDSEANYRCFVLDSGIGQWRTIPDPPSAMKKPCHVVRMGKSLFTIFLNTDLEHTTVSVSYELFAYDTDAEAWTFIVGGPPRPDSDEHAFWVIPQLAVCSGQLFLTAWHFHDNVIRIWKVDVAEKKYAFVADSPVEAEAALLVPESNLACPVDSSRLNPHVDYNGSTGTNVVAVGTDDGRIVFSSVSHRCLEFVVADRSWVRAPAWERRKPVEAFAGLCGGSCVGLFGCVMPLTFCPVPGVAPNHLCKGEF